MSAPWSSTFKVRWADCDVNGHMANTAYSEYATETRVAFLAAHGWPFASFQEAKMGPVILREEIDYLRELRLGEELAVDFTGLGLSNDDARFRLAHQFTRVRDGKVAARIVLTGGWMNLVERRLAPPPALLAGILRGLPRGEEWTVLPDAGQVMRRPG